MLKYYTEIEKDYLASLYGNVCNKQFIIIRRFCIKTHLQKSHNCAFKPPRQFVQFFLLRQKPYDKKIKLLAIYMKKYLPSEGIIGTYFDFRVYLILLSYY